MRGKTTILLFIVLLLAMAPQALAQPAVTALNPFLCYRIKPSKGSEKFEPIPSVTLTGQFESRAVAVLRPLLFCNPAQVGDSAIYDTATHLKGYQLKPIRNLCTDNAPVNGGGECKNERDCGGTAQQTTFCRAQPKPDKISGIHANNQFGPEQLDTLKVEELYVLS